MIDQLLGDSSSLYKTSRNNLPSWMQGNQPFCDKAHTWECTETEGVSHAIVNKQSHKRVT